jgi:hypothetical protein
LRRQGTRRCWWPHDRQAGDSAGLVCSSLPHGSLQHLAEWWAGALTFDREGGGDVCGWVGAPGAWQPGHKHLASDIPLLYCVRDIVLCTVPLVSRLTESPSLVDSLFYFTLLLVGASGRRAAACACCLTSQVPRALAHVQDTGKEGMVCYVCVMRTLGINHSQLCRE